MIKRPPPLWAQMVGSLEAWMPDLATLIADLPQGAATVLSEGTVLDAPLGGYPTDDGTPQIDVERYGPFRARLSAPNRQERHEPDREVLEGHYQLTIAADRTPRESQGVEII